MRDEALMPLTHDHHHALAAARRLQFEEKVVLLLVESLADRGALSGVALAKRDRSGQTT